MGGKYKNKRKRGNAFGSINGAAEIVNDRSLNTKYEPCELKNERLEAYYKEQLGLSEQDFEAMWQQFAQPLPVSFRLTGGREDAIQLTRLMRQHYFADLTKAVESLREQSNGGGSMKSAHSTPLVPSSAEYSDVPSPISWYPGDSELAWQFMVSKSALKKCPEFSRFHAFITTEMEVGNITRQEVVSMIPVLFLDVKAEHFVLDTCASPGSKTSQIIEMIHSGNSDLPSGMIIANDANTDRAYMLVKQSKRLQSPCLMVTNHEAQFFPTIYLNDGPLLFDRILCDVPCSGDGTLRKTKAMWRSWSSQTGVGLHKLQLDILMRSIELLRVGGTIVYSTCSLNPMENEAVVAEAIRLTQGAVQLVDVNDKLPELKRCPGLSSWKVPGSEGALYASHKDVPPSEKKVDKLHKSLFVQEDTSTFGLEKCIRVYPFLQNTGGFFVSAIRKVSSFGALDSKKKKVASSETTIPVSTVEKGIFDDILVDDNAENLTVPQKRKKPLPMTKKWKENPLLFLSKDSKVVETIRSFYDLPQEFPSDQFVVRLEPKKDVSSDIQQEDYFRSIYFCNSAIKNVIEASRSWKLDIVHCGIKMFSKNSPSGPATVTECNYRVNYDGLPCLVPFLSSNRVVSIGIEDFRIFLKLEYPKFEHFSESFKEELSSTDAQSSIIVKLDVGHDLDANADGPYIQGCHYFPVWRANVSASLLLNRKEKNQILYRINPVADAEAVLPADTEVSQ